MKMILQCVLYESLFIIMSACSGEAEGPPEKKVKLDTDLEGGVQSIAKATVTEVTRIRLVVVFRQQQCRIP